MSITAEMVKTLREKTGAGIIDCKKALTENAGDVDKSVEYLRKKGLAAAEKKVSRVAAEGSVNSYIHAGGKIGVLIEINCETDFVAKTDDFQGFVRDMAMHVAAANPLYVKREDVPAEFIAKEKEIFISQAKETGKPANVLEKIVEGKIDKYLAEICLLEQKFVRDPEKSVKDIQTQLIAKLGENISIRRFVRFQLGEGIEKKSENLQDAVREALGE